METTSFIAPLTLHYDTLEYHSGISYRKNMQGNYLVETWLPKLIVILGPTASGKSALAVWLAKRFGGEIISADSRQIYRGLDIGTGKIAKREMRGILHHLLSFQNPKRGFSADQFRKLAERKIRDIRKRAHLPFLVGGTGFYIDAVARGIKYPKVAPNQKLRKALGGKPTKELYRILRALDPARAKTIDRNNPRRLIRAIEIAEATKEPLPKLAEEKTYDALFIGIRRPRPELRRRIRAAIRKRVQRGLLRETRNLIQREIPEKRLAELGLDYGIAADYLKHRISREAMLAKLESATWRYAKRQETWFRKHRDIHWISNETEAKKLVKDFLSKESSEQQPKP